MLLWLTGFDDHAVFEDAVVDATSHRVRPILLTASAAILGMIPIAPTVFWGPMAYAIMGGLAVATLLTVAPDRVSIGYFHDIVEPVSTQPVVASTMGSVSGLVGGHAREIALGMLAIMSLFMASMMVRKSTPAVVPAAPQSTIPVAPSLLSTEPIAGEAASGASLLDGMELNEEAIKAQHMVDQVSTMVRENPDAAAALVKRWLNRT